ncbi:putative pentatricopeptide repeat-containing protein At3g25970 [Papaver somniferum]|nr:putative pentatricopeptide repeat-containing protein At3g25970 [Papaver somniferum]XP_026426399.1 putative pentatricopeptide repeat-containing protein At3g25970 [Papaver somniferum]XP_026426405.1 putative pentatricopeptide repeat-containing protein At3g25970 [Papaver somniferum]XP_026426412.1 putative pentatricopeptide repeat-containing protein At3g25970 [Papaver somniferum]XP_026426419.1 putative pentatricopeptide repeat-containing protein At3g25970 [Papaver somniferum]
MFCIGKVKNTYFSPSFLVNNYSSYTWKKPVKLTRSSDFYGVSISHSEAIKSGTVVDTYIANNILSGYSKCKQINLARQLFEEITQRDIVSWNSMITGYVNLGKNNISWELFKAMKRDGFSYDQFTFGSILKGIAWINDLKAGKQVHSMIIKMGYEWNVFSASALLDMYSKCKRIQDAYQVFECIPEPNFVSWNALITGYAQIGDRETAFFLFDRMERHAIGPDDVTFSSLLTLLDDPKLYKVTMQIHAKMIKCGRLIDTAAHNATITSYSECGSIEDSRKVFEDEDGIRDLVTWNSMLAAYVVHDYKSLAVELFIEMQRHGIEQDMYTYSSILSACFGLKHHKEGKSLHGLAIKRGLDQAVPVCNSLIAMYLKSSNTSMEDAIKCFDSMEFKDNVSWNSILTGFSQNGLSEDSLKFFGWMRSRPLPVDQFAFSAVIRSCSDLATLQLGQQIHVLVLKSGFESDDFVSSSLIFMYSKCGVVEDARKSFDATPRCSTITWNSIIFGYAQHGQGNIALDLFLEMNEKNVKPDHITFVAVLTACSHIGLVEKGLTYLNNMEPKYGIRPRMEHFACGVDLLGRAGHVREAKKLIESMPFEADATVLKTLLGACRLHGDLELATEIAKRLLILEPDEHCTYVLLSSMYGHLGSWEEKASIKRLMKERMVKKVPGWSWIEVKNEVHSFNAEDRSHPQHEEVYQRLEELMEEIRWLYNGEDEEFSNT